MIYYIEDDKNIRDLVVYTLNQNGLMAEGFSSAEELWDHCRIELPQMILLDIMLPREDGISILKSLRRNSKTKSIPVLMVTAKGDEYNRVFGLDSGADDYITKPFSMIELVARVKAVLRRTIPEEPSEELRIGNLAMHVKKHVVTVKDIPVALTLKEYELLRKLMENQGVAFNREQLLSSVWGYDYEGGTRTVDVHMQTLRQKLGDCAGFIKTVHGIGYRIGE